MSAPSPPHPQHEFVSLMRARVGDAFLRKPFFVEGTLDLVSVCRLMAEQGLADALVRDGERIGMFTTTDLRDALLRTPQLAALAVREVAHFELIEIGPEREVFEALLLMVRHRVHRLVVRDGARGVVGVLNQLDLMSFLSNHSIIAAAQIAEAASIDELKAAAGRVDALVALLHRGGVRVEQVAALVSELNTRLIQRAWSLVAPAELIEASCLVVMGSEGRGEQILKTDQDNALLLRDGLRLPGIEAAALRLNAALAELGWPPCPGGVMLTNPLWRQELAAFRDTLRDWVYGADPEAPMRLAIFFDAAPIAGDATLLHEARAYLDRILTADNDALLARFARAADQFDEPATHWWVRLSASRRDEQPIDLKKLGTFPIVHGVRALALRYRVRDLGTEPRLAALVAAQHIEAALARDVLDALRFLMGLKLTHQLRQRDAAATPGNLVRPSDLGLLERDQLKDSLVIIRRFRGFIREHFKLDAL